MFEHVKNYGTANLSTQIRLITLGRFLVFPNTVYYKDSSSGGFYMYHNIQERNCFLNKKN